MVSQEKQQTVVALPTSPDQALRQQAEARVRVQQVLLLENSEAMSSEAAQLMLHELRVHQIELEMQNEELRRAQLELDAARARYFDLYDLAPVGYCTVGDSGMIQEANLTLASLLGIARSTLVRKPLSRYIFNEDVISYHQHRKQTLETGKSLVFEVRMVKEDGRPFWGQFAVAVAKDDDGTTVLRIVINDISERKQSERILEEKLVLLQSRDDALASISQGVLITGSDQLITYANREFESITGYPLAETIGRNCNFLQGLDTSQETVTTIRHALRSGQPYHGEILNYRKDGRGFWNELSITPVFDHERRLVQFVGVQHDITEKKRTEKELRESEMRRQFAVEIHGDAIWEWDADKDELSLTAMARELFNLPNTESKQPIADLLSQVIDEDRALVEGQINDVIAGRSSEVWGEWRLRSSGTIRWIATGARVMTRTPEGRPHRIVGISSDVSAKRNEATEAQRQRKLLEHQGRLVILGELASALAHEINQPLTAISGFAAACIRKTARDPEVLELVRAIEEQAIRAGAIAWRMRGFARRQSIGRSAHSLSKVVIEVAKWIRMDSSHLDIVIDVSGVSADLPWVNVDRIELEQVLVNLMQNGIEAGLPNTYGQRITITGEIGRHLDEIEISVTDWGCGLPASADLDVFQPFSSSKEQGLGLGLTICFSIIEGHGGRLWATPNPEGGTVFHFTLPMAGQSKQGQGIDTPATCPSPAYRVN